MTEPSKEAMEWARTLIHGEHLKANNEHDNNDGPWFVTIASIATALDAFAAEARAEQKERDAAIVLEQRFKPGTPWIGVCLAAATAIRNQPS